MRSHHPPVAADLASLSRARACRGLSSSLLGVALLQAMLVGSTGIASAATITPVMTVSGPSPIATCGAVGLHDGTPAVNFPNAEVEPRVAAGAGVANRVLVGVWQQDRWSTGGAHGIGAASSQDGGKTWSRSLLPFGECARVSSAYTVTSDPWVSAGPDGTVYATALVASNSGSGVKVVTSHDAGRTWSGARTIHAVTLAKGEDDKESITADPVKEGWAYAVWAHSPRGGEEEASGALSSWFSRTADGGRTWTAPREIVKETTAGQGAQGNQILSDPKRGMLYDVFFHVYVKARYKRSCKMVRGVTTCIRVRVANKHPSLHFAIAAVRSADGGTTWSRPRDISPFTGAIFPSTAVRTGDPGPQACIDLSTGSLYVVWNDGRPTAELLEETMISKSTDAGLHWTAPAVVGARTGAPTFTPSVAVNADGVVGVTYFTGPIPPEDPTAAPEDTEIPAEYWFTSSSDGGRHFRAPARIAGPFPMSSAPNAVGYFLGDYQGLAAAGSTFHAFFAAPNAGDRANPTDIFSASISP